MKISIGELLETEDLGGVDINDIQIQDDFINELDPLLTSSDYDPMSIEEHSNIILNGSEESTYIQILEEILEEENNLIQQS